MHSFLRFSMIVLTVAAFAFSTSAEAKMPKLRNEPGMGSTKGRKEVFGLKSESSAPRQTYSTTSATSAQQHHLLSTRAAANAHHLLSSRAAANAHHKKK